MKKIIRIFTSRALILSIQVLLSAIFLFIVYETNIIPQKYFMMIAAAFVVLLGIFWLIIQTGKKKAKDSLANEKGGQSAHLYFRGKTRSCPEKSIKFPTRRPAEAHAAVRHIRRSRPNHQSK